MKEKIEAIKTWIMSNKLIAAVVAVVVLLVLFRKKIFRRTARRRRPVYHHTVARRTHRVRKAYTKGGKAKKPWQIKGSEAARRHMRKIRSMR